jgi:hypothetical protein
LEINRGQITTLAAKAKSCIGLSPSGKRAVQRRGHVWREKVTVTMTMTCVLRASSACEEVAAGVFRKALPAVLQVKLNIRLYEYEV